MRKRRYLRFPGILLCELKKMCFSPAFCLGILGTALLMTMDTYSMINGAGEERYTLFEILIRGKEWMLQERNFNWEEFVIQQPGRQFMDYVTVLASLPFLISFCGERKSGSIRFHIVREGRKKYYASKLLTGMSQGGLLVGGGYVIFLFLTWLRAPRAAESGIDISYMLPEGISPDKFSYYILFCIIGMVLYGMSAAAFGIALSAFTTDIYVCLTIPFLIKWVNGIFCSYLYTYLYIEHEKIEGSWMRFLDGWKEKGCLEQIFYETRNGNLKTAVGLLVCVFTVTAVVFCLRMNERKDYGK